MDGFLKKSKIVNLLLSSGFTMVVSHVIGQYYQYMIE